MPEANRPDQPRTPPEPRSPLWSALIVVLLALAAFGAWRLWWEPRATETTSPPIVVDDGEPIDGSDSLANAGPDAGADSLDQKPPAEPLHPVAKPAEGAEQDPQAFERALSEAIGASAFQYLIPDELAQRIVATVDNLARPHAPARIWPVSPTAGRFQVDRSDDGTTTITAANEDRYSALVAIAESVDPARVAAVYSRFYPVFQRAYEEIGFPGRPFNDRLVAVIDHLLQAPRPTQPIPVTLLEVRTEAGEPPARPWVRYEFADPALESLSAGQKIMIRIGPDNRRRLEAVLGAFRRQVADGALTRPR